MRPGVLTGPSVIAVLGRDVVVRLLEISRSGCLLESSHAMPAGTIAALAIEIDGREYTDDVRVSRSQLLAGVGERYQVGVEFLWLRLPRERSLRSYAAMLPSDPKRLTISGAEFGERGFQKAREGCRLQAQAASPTCSAAQRTGPRRTVPGDGGAPDRPFTKHW